MRINSGGKGSKWVIPLSHGSSPTESEFTKSKDLADVSTHRSVDMSNDEYERIRAHYRRKTIKVLLVGESRPTNGTFFYLGNSNLYKYTVNAFARLLDHDFTSSEEFLSYFQRTGYFLDDLCQKPINKLLTEQRTLARQSGVNCLSNRISNYSPKAVICVMKEIQEYVRQAVVQSGVHLEKGFYCIPFPTRRHQLRYESDLLHILKKL